MSFCWPSGTLNGTGYPLSFRPLPPSMSVQKGQRAARLPPRIPHRDASRARLRHSFDAGPTASFAVRVAVGCVGSEDWIVAMKIRSDLPRPIVVKSARFDTAADKGACTRPPELARTAFIDW